MSDDEVSRIQAGTCLWNVSLRFARAVVYAPQKTVGLHPQTVRRDGATTQREIGKTTEVETAGYVEFRSFYLFVMVPVCFRAQMMVVSACNLCSCSVSEDYVP